MSKVFISSVVDEETDLRRKSSKVKLNVMYMQFRTVKWILLMKLKFINLQENKIDV